MHASLEGLARGMSVYIPCVPHLGPGKVPIAGCLHAGRPAQGQVVKVHSCGAPPSPSLSYTSL